MIKNGEVDTLSMKKAQINKSTFKIFKIKQHYKWVKVEVKVSNKKIGKINSKCKKSFFSFAIWV